MKKRLIISLIIVLALFSAVAELAIAEKEIQANLEKGKNLAEINKTILVSELVSANPEIEYVAYFDEFLNKNISFVNAFGGIGKNFLIESGKTYEIFVSKNTSIVTYKTK